MKLRNLMYATMIACAFASCSKDDVIDGGQEPAKGDASLTISVGTKATKGIIMGTDAETTVNDINIFLCDENNAVIERAYLDANIVADETVTFSDLAVGQTLHCVGFANLGKELTTIPANQALTVADNTSGTDLPMHGLSGTVTIHAGENEATITLVRDLARVELEGVTLNMGHADADEFTSGTFDFDFVSASINSAPSSSTVTFATTVTPADNRSFVVGSPFVGGLGSAWSWSTTANTGEAVSSYIVADETVNKATYIIDETTSAQTVTIPTSIVFYVLPNEATLGEDEEYTNANPTALTLRGTMDITDAVRSNGQTVASSSVDAYYNIEIGKTGTVTGQTPGAGILPNKSYKINLTVIGTGGGIGGDRPYLVVNTAVKDWDEVTQTAPVK